LYAKETALSRQKSGAVQARRHGWSQWRRLAYPDKFVQASRLHYGIAPIQTAVILVFSSERFRGPTVKGD
jgi:hypothetical protein